MAETREDKAAADALTQLISFMIGKEEYGLEILTVKEVIRIREITKIPKAPVFVKGIINLRGDVIPIIDLREKFGLETEEYTIMTRVIIVEVDGKAIGMVVDSVSQVIEDKDQRIGEKSNMAGKVKSHSRGKIISSWRKLFATSSETCTK